MLLLTGLSQAYLDHAVADRKLMSCLDHVVTDRAKPGLFRPCGDLQDRQAYVMAYLGDVLSDLGHVTAYLDHVSTDFEHVMAYLGI